VQFSSRGSSALPQFPDRQAPIQVLQLEDVRVGRRVLVRRRL
jgi:hypothetical protein